MPCWRVPGTHQRYTQQGTAGQVTRQGRSLGGPQSNNGWGGRGEEGGRGKEGEREREREKGKWKGEE